MWKKVLVVGGTTAAIVGAGTAALAVTGSGSPTPTPSASSPATAQHHQKARHAGAGALRHGLHGTLTVKHAKAPGGFQTFDAIRGTVTAVSPTSITVKAADGVSETYAVTSNTVVHLKADGKSKGQTGQIGKVADGDAVGVLGTGTATFTATHVVDRTH